MNKAELCRKIEEIYPDIGRCAIDVEADWDEEKKAWAVRLTRGGRELVTYLEEDDVNACMEGRQCVALGIQVAELSRNIEERPETRQSEGV